MEVAIVVALTVALVALLAGFAFWGTRQKADREDNLAGFAARSPGFTVEERRTPGLFAHRYAVAVGVHRNRPVALQSGTDGWNTKQPATHTHTVAEVPEIRGLPPGLRVFPSMTGGLAAKGGRRGEAEAWLDSGLRRAELEQRLATTGYVALSDALGLRLHAAGTSLPDAELVALLDDLTLLADALERPV